MTRSGPPGRSIARSCPGGTPEQRVCVVPSRFEAFGYSCLEATACGQPVVASDPGGLAEIVDAG